MSKFGLGRGLGALIPQHEPKDENAEALNNTDETPDISDPSIKVVDIPVEDVLSNPYQPRKIFNPDSLQEMADSIREHGILQPITVTVAVDGKYELIAGERRLEASKIVGLKTIPAIVKKQAIDDKEKLELALIENIQREDLNLIEQARSFKKLHEEFNLTYDQVAMKLGKSSPAVKNIVRLLTLPAEIQRGVIEGKITEGHCRGLLQVADRDRQLSLYEMIVDKKLNSEQAMALGREWTARPHLLKPRAKETTESRAIENQLKAKLGAKRLTVNFAANGGGTIKIMFLSEDEFREIADRINSIS